MQDYEQRLKIPIIGDKTTEFRTKSLIIANGYERIVIGKRGPYIEFNKDQIVKSNLIVPGSVKWKFESKYRETIFYHEYRTVKDYVKVYYQTRPVDYADYKIGMYYISSFDLYVNGERVIEKLNDRTKKM